MWLLQWLSVQSQCLCDSWSVGTPSPMSSLFHGATESPAKGGRKNVCWQMSQKLARPRRSASRWKSCSCRRSLWCMCSKTVDSVVRDRSCLQKLRARAVAWRSEHGNSKQWWYSEDHPRKVTTGAWGCLCLDSYKGAVWLLGGARPPWRGCWLVMGREKRDQQIRVSCEIENWTRTSSVSVERESPCSGDDAKIGLHGELSSRKCGETQDNL